LEKHDKQNLLKKKDLLVSFGYIVKFPKSVVTS